MASVLVSVVIPAYNHGEFIADTLRSVVNQSTNFRFEILVGDDGSTDETPRIVRDYADKYPGVVVPVLRKTNVGGQRNLNDLYLMARGEFIAVLDGDDLMCPERLQEQVNFFKRHPECGSVFHDMEVVEDGRVVGRFCQDLDGGLYGMDDLVQKGTFVPHSSKMFRRFLLPKEGFPVYENLRGLDWLHHLITANGFSVGYIPQVLGWYRKHPDSNTRSVKKGNLLPYYYGQKVALDYASEAGIKSGPLSAGFRRIYIDNIRRALRFSDFDAYSAMLSDISKNDVGFGARDSLVFLWGGKWSVIFWVRSCLFRVKNS
ncbi:glycosyltransferase family 2 protein [Guyparkeria sp. GHLCS8-2]|uniref:glycosyltransferase family 2 protein n=1 Tax=Guyparkeria halopsychrophila TaxID=3139421 RepID=UPI0037C74115